MSQTIKSISVKGLWDIKDVSVTFNEDVNILIGGNGTGKTTLLKILEGILNVDLQNIDDIVEQADGRGIAVFPADQAHLIDIGGNHL